MGKILITSPFKKHGVVEGLLRDLNSSEHEIVLYNYGEVPEMDFTNYTGFTEYISPLPEKESKEYSLGERENYHRENLEKIMQKHDTQLLIPTSEKFLNLVVNHPQIFSNKTYVPSKEVLEVNLDKLKTYDFYGKFALPVPNAISVNPKNPEGLERFIKDNGTVFMKPSVSTSGRGAKKINNMRDFYNNYSDVDEELVASELLNLPEYTHIVLVEDGKVHNAATYVGPGSIGFSEKGYLERQAVNIPKIFELGEAVVDSLREVYGSEKINGAYNMDFLTRDNGEYILSEVNPGRLPGGHSAITASGYNIAEDYISTGLRVVSSMAA